MDRVTHKARSDEPRAPLPRRKPAPGTGAAGAARGGAQAGQNSVFGQPIPARPTAQPGRSARVPRTSRVRTARSGEERYRPGRRRTAAEPLRASWRPAEDEASQTGERAATRTDTKSKLTKLASTYGWRVYALPILLVITVLVVVNTASSPAEPGDQQVVAQVPGAGGDPAAATENPAKPVDLNIPTAELPEGGQFTESGKGSWHIVPGQGKKVGSGGKLYTYTVAVEDGIDPASYAGDDSFGTAVQGILSDPRSWTGDGKVSLQRVDGSAPNPDFQVSLTTPNTAHRADVCGFQIRYESSCYRRSLGRVVINLSRWVRGATAFSADMTGYRQYAINHEVGHALGNGHVGCDQDGALAPVMMQQSFGVSNNYVAQLNQADPTNYSAVAADGKTCKPNAWPNPQPQGAR